MFTVEPRFDCIPATRTQVVSVHASLNRPHIGVPGKAAQEVQAYIVGVSVGAGSMTAFVYLYLTATREAAIYIDPDNLRVAPSAYSDAEAEAIGFVESMGFMLENLNYQALAPDQQDALIKSLPCFVAAAPAPSQAGGEASHERAADPPQVRLARYLASF
jgi:hypothetical protein